MTTIVGMEKLMIGSIEGKIALVTGAARGLGLSIARHLAAAGANGLAVDLHADFQDIPANWLSHEGDVSDESDMAASIESLRARFGRLDIVVANAGLVPPWRDTEDIDLAEWDQVFAVNVRGVMATIKTAVPLMRATGGSIIVMGSRNSYRSHPRQCLYTATKHAVLGIVRASALDLGRYGIRVNALGPGPITTDALVERIHARTIEGGPPVQEAFDRHACETALGRMASEEDVAKTALFLAGDQSSGITGQLFPVDAGLG